MNRSFQRKVAYLLAIAALLAPLALVGRPSTTVVGAAQEGAGGKLAQLRERYKLGQAQIGRIDPTSSAMRYLSLGMHGFAVCILNQKAEQYQRQEDWINLGAVLKQTTYLLPYSVKAWDNQAWNVAYNVSSKFDDFRDKYFWVVRGLKLFPQAMEFNELEPLLPHGLGWHVAHKLGQADERREFRRLFARDDQLHREPWAEWVDRRDSWLFGKRYLERAQELVDHRGALLRSTGAENFHVQTPICQGLYAAALEREGTFGDQAKAAWRQAHADWLAFGAREMPSVAGGFYRFDGLADAERTLTDAVARLEKLAPGARELILAEKRAALSPEMRRALDAPKDGRTEKEDILANKAERLVYVADWEVAERAPADKRQEARQAAEAAQSARALVGEIKGSRRIFNYEYWLDRTKMESSDEALAARQSFYEAMQKADDDPWAARRAFEDGFRRWRGILDKYPAMVDDQTSYDVNEYVVAYRRVLKQLDEPFDMSKFILRDLAERHEQPEE